MRRSCSRHRPRPRRRDARARAQRRHARHRRRRGSADRRAADPLVRAEVAAGARLGKGPIHYPGCVDVARRLRSGDARLVRARVRRADAGAGARLAGDRLRRAHADPGADRLGKDARRVPLRHRPAHRGGRGQGTAAPLRLAAQGAQLRHRAQPARAARRPRVGPPRRRPHGRHAAARARADAPRAPGHPDHDTRVALPAAHVAGAGDAPRGPDARRSTRCTRSPATKRGAHLALSLERLDRLTGKPIQRIGLSATQRPLEEIGRFVSGGRPIRLVDAGVSKQLDLQVVVPVEDMREPGAGADLEGLPGGSGEGRGTSIWPSIYPEVLRLVREHRSTIVFVNNRRLAERLALRLNELARGRDCARAPRLDRARAARRDRGAAEARRDPVPRRDVVARARHRHGRRRPRDPGRVAEVGRARAAADRPRRPLARRGVDAGASSRSSAPTCSRRR